MRVFKTTYKDKLGRTREAPKWYVEFRDHLETVRRLPAFESKSASAELGRNLDKLVAYHKASGGQTDPALTRFLAGLPGKTRMRLVAIGLLAPDRVAVAKPLAEHLRDFTAALAAKGNSAFHVETVSGRARRVFDGCGFRFYGDIHPGKVMEHLHALRADARERRGISAQTFNFYVQAVKQFCRWMVNDRRALESPVGHLHGLNVKTDRRRDRRAFTVGELRRLLEAAQTGPRRGRAEGRERALLYWLAAETGLRANEARSLIRSSFALDAEPPTVTVAAAYSKHRRQDTLFLRPALTAALRDFLSVKTPDAPAFHMPKDRKRASAVFQADLAAARIPYRDATGLVADFHSLRHTFVTNLANGGIHPKTAQTLARHGTISLTMDRYSHTLREQEIDALAALPDLTIPREALRATGTEDHRPVESGATETKDDLASRLALQGRFSAPSVDSVGPPGAGLIQCENAEKTGVSAGFFSAGSVCTSGGGPGLQNQWAA